MYTQFLEVVDPGKAYLFFNSRSLWDRSRVDLGVGRGGRGHPFFLEIVFYFYRIIRKIKSGWQVGKCPGHAFLNFLDPPLKVKERSLRKVTSY